MPARLRQLSQDWASLAVRGFDKSAQAEIDKNDRERAQLQGIGNVVASGIVRKKGRERQDKLLAEERARDDAIRAERYGREDARYASENAREDARYAEQRRYKQAELDLDAIKMTQAEMVAAAQEAGSPDPATQMAAQARMEGLQGRLSTLQARYLQLSGVGQPEPVGAPATAVGSEPPAKSMRGAPMPAPMEGYVSLLPKSAGAPKPAARPAPAAPVAPAGAPAAAPALDGMPPPSSREEQIASTYTARRLDAEARYKSSMAAAEEATQRAKDSNKSPRAERDWQIKAKAHLDAANAAQREAAALKTNEAAWGEKAKQAQVAAQKQEATRAKTIEGIRRARASNVPTEFIQRGLEAGITDWDAYIAGAVKKPEDVPETPEQMAARKRAEQDALAKQGLTPEGKLPSPEKPGEEADPLKRLLSMDKSLNYDDRTLEVDRFSPAEIVALASNPNTPEKYRPAIQKRAAELGVADAIRGVKVPDPFGGGAAAPAPKQRATAAAEFKSLPPEAQTPEAWAAIKRKHGL